MKTLRFTVAITMSGKVSSDDDFIKEMAKNIAESIKHTADTSGITPDGCDEYAAQVDVIPEFLPDETITIKLDI